MSKQDLASRSFKAGQEVRLRPNISPTLLPSSPFAGANPVATSPSPRNPRRRHFFVYRLLFIALLFLSLGAVNSIFSGFESTTLTMLVAAITLLAAFIGTTIVLADLIRRRWIEALQKTLTIAFSVAFFVPAMRMGDHVHLILFYPYYSSEIRKSGDVDRLTRFDWGDDAALVTDGAIIKTLVYDPAGLLKQYVGQRRRSSIGGLYTDHLFGDFYLETDLSSG